MYILDTDNDKVKCYLLKEHTCNCLATPLYDMQYHGCKDIQQTHRYENKDWLQRELFLCSRKAINLIMKCILNIHATVCVNVWVFVH